MYVIGHNMNGCAVYCEYVKLFWNKGDVQKIAHATK